MYLTLGGKIEPGESDIECLKREIKEELGCESRKPAYFDTFEGRIFDNSKSIHMKCFLIEIVGEPHLNPEDNITAYRWVGKDYKQEGILVAPLLGQKVIPALIAKGLL